MLRFSPNFAEQMKLHAGRTYPEECCGILLGTIEGEEKVVRDIMELTNSSEAQRTRRYIVTPEDYQKAEISAREKGMDVLGFYHSHPDHPARPSQFDLEHAFPSWSYIIIGVEKGHPSAMTSWLLQEDRSRFDEEHFEIVNEE